MKVILILFIALLHIKLVSYGQGFKMENDSLLISYFKLNWNIIPDTISQLKLLSNEDVNSNLKNKLNQSGTLFSIDYKFNGFPQFTKFIVLEDTSMYFPKVELLKLNYFKNLEYKSFDKKEIKRKLKRKKIGIKNVVFLTSNQSEGFYKDKWMSMNFEFILNYKVVEKGSCASVNFYKNDDFVNDKSINNIDLNTKRLVLVFRNNPSRFVFGNEIVRHVFFDVCSHKISSHLYLCKFDSTYYDPPFNNPSKRRKSKQN